MHRVRGVRWIGLRLVALLLATAVVAGCAAGREDAPEEGSSGKTEKTQLPVPEVAQSPATEPPPANSLAPERAAQIAGQCPGAIDAAGIEELNQNAADAVDFLSETGQCGDIAAVLAAADEAAEFVSPLQYADARCPQGTLLSFWAHFDDDLIFGSPSIPRALGAGQCVRTFFFTGGDAGMGHGYAAEREIGIRSAYDVMRGAATPWTDRTVTLRTGVTLTLTRPADDPRITLFFLRLPDGGLDANGFESTGHQSMPKLWTGEIPAISTIDGAQQLTLDQLKGTVGEVAAAYQPTQILAHLPGFAAGSGGDHPDHRTTGRIVAANVDAGAIDPAIVSYAQGYPSENNAQNLSGDELAGKIDAFVAYAVHDAVLRCDSRVSCLQLHRFGSWLQRQYLIGHADLQPAA